MKLLYCHPSRIVIDNLFNVLSQAGIETQRKNEFASGGVGELAPIDVWPELWVLNERDEEQAEQLLAQCLRELPPWECTQCHESNPGSFDSCWSCQHEHPER